MNWLRLSFVLVASTFFVPHTAWAQSQPPQPEHWWSQAVDAALEQSGTNRVQWVQALQTVPPTQREGLQFLLENMPLRDLKTLSASFLLEDVAQAYAAMDAVPWGKSLPHEIFLNDVLPYITISEKREAWRKPLFDKCLPLIKGCKTPGEAAQRLNETLFGLVKVKYSTERKRADQSPSESMETGLASCTGLSILLLDACRSVGVPARMAGVPNWADDRGNHSWVEIWDQRWQFTGAAEPDPKGLNHAWFETDAALAVKSSREHAIYAVSYKKTGLLFPLVMSSETDEVSAINVTDHYTASTPPFKPGKTRLLVKVLDGLAGHRVAAQVRIVDLADSAHPVAGTSHDEHCDANDLLTFDIPQKHAYTIEARWEGKIDSRPFNSLTNDQDLVTLHLTPAPPASSPVIKPLKPRQDASLKKELTAFFSATPEQQAHWKFSRALNTLLQDNESAVRQAAWSAYASAPLHQALKEDYKQSQVRFENYLSPYTIKYIGQKPPSGWPLFIAMHGGGGTTREVNDSQWKIMETHYKDQPGLPGYCYLALRAPNDTWNGFYDDYVYPLIANLIRQQVIFGQIDPDKVFLMGYSHGGYGAFAIGPKMPDHFAAIHASAAAPTDGETAAANLRNTPFTYMVGEHDLDYDRLKRCQAFDQAICKLRGENTNSYPVTLEYRAGKHHSDLDDRDKIKQMYPATRQTVPAQLRWELTDGVIHDFFWLEVPTPGKTQEISANCQTNRISVTSQRMNAANLLLDSRLVNFKQPLQLEVNGQVSSIKVKPSLLVLCQTLMERGDPQLAFTARVQMLLKK